MFFCSSAGGLVTAVCPVVIKGNGLWVGWPGIHTEEPITDIPESDPNDQTPTAGLKSDQVCKMKTLKTLSFAMKFSNFTQKSSSLLRKLSVKSPSIVLFGPQ